MAIWNDFINLRSLNKASRGDEAPDDNPDKPLRVAMDIVTQRDWLVGPQNDNDLNEVSGLQAQV